MSSYGYSLMAEALGQRHHIFVCVTRPYRCIGVEDQIYFIFLTS